MRRLDLLKKELEIVKNLRTLSFDCKEVCIDYYMREIDAITIYGSFNPEYKGEPEVCSLLGCECPYNVMECPECGVYITAKIAKKKADEKL